MIASLAARRRETPRHFSEPAAGEHVELDLGLQPLELETAVRFRARLGRRRVQICARLGEQLRLIPIEDIYCFTAGQKYVTVRHRGGSDLIDESLRALAAEFAPDFVRVHRNSLVAMRHVRAVERSADGQYLVRLAECDALLPVSRRHATTVLRVIRGGSLS